MKQTIALKILVHSAKAHFYLLMLSFIALKKTLCSYFFLHRGFLLHIIYLFLRLERKRLIDLRSKSFSEFPKRQSFVGLKGSKAISMVKSLFGVSMIVDILDDFLFPSPPRTPRRRFFSSPDRGFGNLVRPSVSSSTKEECFFMAILIFCSDIRLCDLLQLDWFHLLDVLVVVFFLVSHPEVSQISFSKLFRSLFSQISVMDFGILRSSLDVVPITPNLEVSDVSEIVEAPSLSSLSPKSNSSGRIAFLVGMLFLAVLLTKIKAASNYMNEFRL